MDNNSLIKAFWNCGDTEIIEFAIARARLNKNEREVLCLILDDCLTQEQAAEALNYSTRRIQTFWSSATKKLLSIPWVIAFACSIKQ